LRRTFRIETAEHLDGKNGGRRRQRALLPENSPEESSPPKMGVKKVTKVALSMGGCLKGSCEGNGPRQGGPYFTSAGELRKSESPSRNELKGPPTGIIAMGPKEERGVWGSRTGKLNLDPKIANGEETSPKES